MTQENLICIGCGTKIQTDDPHLPGFTPKAALERDPVLCQRCFRLKHYNDVVDVEIDNDEFLKILHGIGESENLVVKIVDIFDFNGSWLPGIHRFIGDNDCLLVGNKVDLLPRSTNKERLKKWLRHEAESLGLKPVDVILVSAEKGYHISEAMEKIEYYRKGKDVYVIGCTNVGKSTFINRIIEEVTGEKDLITTSFFPGTTLDRIEIPLDDGKAIYDTPGIINPHQMAHFVSKQDLKIITPKKEIKPKVYQLNEGQTLFFGGLARLDFVKGARNSFVCYLSNELRIHRTKLERADDLYRRQKGDLLSPPDASYADEFPRLVSQEFSLKAGKTDIVFSGLGWVMVANPGAVVRAHVPKGVHVYVRKALI